MSLPNFCWVRLSGLFWKTNSSSGKSDRINPFLYTIAFRYCSVTQKMGMRPKKRFGRGCKPRPAFKTAKKLWYYRSPIFAKNRIESVSLKIFG
jgi:hypothetical protein